jgi:hypothetical protein
MSMQKIGLNLSKLNNLSVPSFNISNSSTEIIAQIPEKANELTSNYLGLGIMTISTVRSVGVAGGIVALMGLQMLNFGYFTEYFHVVIYMGILFVCTLFLFLADRR